ncbi:MAG: PD-(D/E)XK nuclease family transposase, partial [Butyrivibrio sp.]|nr:PD-(D/E)XK nuclease family transposase [Butyrivibrio sp.]
MDKKTKPYPDEIYRRIDGFRLFDDTFMSKVFDGQKEETALLLQIILDDPGIKVISVHAQVEIKNLQGRSARLDIRARGSNGVIFAVEVQRADAGAIPKRAREISSLIDANALKVNQDFDKLPETYVIFITEHDVLEKERPIYHIDRIIQESGEPFGDMAHIIYVNGETDDDTAIGMLMHDFHCTQAKDMYYPILAERVRYFKETQRGRDSMCTIVEEYAEERVKEAVSEAVSKANKAAIINGLRGGILTKDTVSVLYPKLKPAEIETLYKESQKPPRRSR